MRLEEIQFISHVPRDGRTLLMQPWFNHESNQWHMYFERSPGDFIEIAMVDYYHGIYFSSAPAAEGDMEIPLANLVAQHLTFKGVPKVLFSLVDDFNMLCACLKKISMLSGVSDNYSTFLVQSEIEYLFSLVRAKFDIMQMLIKKIASLLTPQDGGRPISALPDSFAAIALSGDQVRSEDEIITKWNLPHPLAQFYHASAAVFRQVRSVRVAIEHCGKNVPAVFVTNQGLGIQTSGLALWGEMEVWSMHEIQANGIGSVRSLASFLALYCIDSCSSLERALRSIIDPGLLPPAIVSESTIFFRNPLSSELLGLEGVIRSPWVTS